ncbi:MAG: hypothetical protein H7Z74_03245 [Anaerolineae bacterium]|nr:hypothetical protein [Gemmatimonadaceae bacterium]
MPDLKYLPGNPALLEALSYGLDSPPTPETLRLVAYIAKVFGSSTIAIIHYGSHAQQSGAKPESAHDFFVIVDRYAPAYRSFRAAIGHGFRASTAIVLARVLPPNVVRLSLPHQPLQGKCAVLSLAHLQDLTSPRSLDHFTQGRLFQHVQLVWTRDAESRGAVREALVNVRAGTFAWGRPYLPGNFDVESYFRILLETSFAGEIRPEANDRVAQLLAAQRDTMLRVYTELLQHLAASRIVVQAGKVYSQIEQPSRMDRLRVRMYFKRSKARATLRWFKHVALYDNWLDYIVQKIARRAGQTIELTPLERRWPLLFLWPRAVRFLMSRPQRQGRQHDAL